MTEVVLLSHLRSLSRVKRYAVCRELHAVPDGPVPAGQHFHVLIEYYHRLQGDIRVFDVSGYHPNIKGVKHGAKVYEDHFQYVSKDGDYRVFDDSVNNYDTSMVDGLARRLNDRTAYSALRRTRACCSSLLREGFFPFVFDVDRELGLAVNLSVRRRHFWLWGDAHAGKSTACAVFCAKNKLTRFVLADHAAFAWDLYAGEQVIIMEDRSDVSVSVIECLSSDLWKVDCSYGGEAFGSISTTRRTPGQTRYRPTFLPNANLVVLVTSNAPPPYALRDWPGFLSRFHVVHVSSWTQFRNQPEFE